MKFKAVLFDLDGTLVDSAAGIIAAIHATATELCLPLPTHEHVRGAVGDGVHNLLRRCFPTATALEPVLRVYDQHYARMAGALTQPYPGIPELLAALPAHSSAVISNKAQAHCLRILEELKLTRYCAHVSGGDSYAERKPSPLPLLAACKALGVAAADTLMVGDGPQDLRAARAAGIRSCAVLWGFGSERDLRALHPDFMARDVSELRAHLGTL
ncbi:MAG: HAD family hydrolase [Planctomycetes bacterium]|nr:HAD family hydrolase [Planctomycetota bacterium]